MSATNVVLLVRRQMAAYTDIGVRVTDPVL